MTRPISGTTRLDPREVFNKIPTVRWIPRSLVPLASASFASVLRRVCDRPDEEERWLELLRWPRTRLAAPTVGGGSKKGERTRVLREQILTGSGGDDQRRAFRKRYDTNEDRLATAVRRRIDTGDVRGAVRVFVNEGRIIEASVESAAIMESKHPLGESVVANSTEEPLTATKEEIVRAITTMPAGGAPGIDGLRPSHLKQLVGPSAGDARDRASGALEDFVAVCLSGDIPPNIRPYFFGAALCALRKKDGGLRPIAIGLVLRRLVSRICCITIRERAVQLLSPIQLGIGVSGGAEAAVHATRRYLYSCQESSGIVKLDFVNAFNCVNRHHILSTVERLVPGLDRYARAAYSTPSHLMFGDRIISSSCGVQQGDPLGPLLFSLAVRHISHATICPFNVWYLDDATLGGTLTEIAAGIEWVREEASKIGLLLNESKCEAIGSGGFLSGVKTFMPRFKLVPLSEGELLGAPLCPDSASRCITRRTESIKAITPRLATIDRHDALLLLRASLGHPKILYSLRAGPCFKSTNELTALDDAIASAFESGVCVPTSANTWQRATLPVHLGGVGVLSPRDVALPAFLASSGSVRDLADGICNRAPDSELEDAHRRWSEITGQPVPVEASERSSTWAAPLTKLKLERFKSSLRTPADVARLLAASTESASCLYAAIPSSKEGTRLSDATLSLAVGLRLGLPVATAGVCSCGEGFYSNSIVIYYCTIVLLYYCTTVLLYYCTTVLLYYCTTVLLYYCTTVLLYYCTTVLRLLR